MKGDVFSEDGLICALNVLFLVHKMSAHDDGGPRGGKGGGG